jgi:PKD repeat protein
MFGLSDARTCGARRRAALFAGLALAVCAQPAFAADPVPNGELSRWGGSTAVGARQLGLLSGFAVDPVDDSVYAVDRQSADYGTGTSTFRVRKFAGANGELIATGIFTSTGPVTVGPPSVAAVEIDHAGRHVYVAVAAAPEFDVEPVLHQIHVLSTEPTGGTLSFPADVADGTLLDAAPALRYGVAMTVDRATGDVLVGGIDPSVLAPTVRRFHGVGASPGGAAGSWTGPTAGGAAYTTALAVDGQSRVYLATRTSLSGYGGTVVRRLGSDLGSAAALMPTTTQGASGGNFLATLGAETSSTGYNTRTLGTQLAVAPNGDLLAPYAGTIRFLFPVGAVGEPFSSAAGSPLSFGIRRFAANGEDLGIVAGGGADGAACNVRSFLPEPETLIGAFGIGLGSGGKIFTPSTLADGSVEMVVLGPGGNGCPVPSPALRATGPDGEIAVGASAPIGGEVTLDLAGSDLRTWPLLEVDWDLDGDTGNGAESDGFEVKNRRPIRDVDPLSPAPSLSTRRTWNAAGTYTIRARILTTGGTAVISREIRVAAAPVPPTAVLTGPATGTAGTAVSFDASGSRAQPVGSTAALTYEWDFGDSAGAFRAGAARQAHTYATAGIYSVRVRVTDGSNGRQTVSATRTIVVRAAPTIDPPREDPPGQDPPRQDPPRQDPPRQDPPADTTPPVLTVRTTTAIGRNGLLALQLGCPAGERSCAGSAELKTAAAVASATARRGRGRGRRAKRSRLTLGRATFTAAGGRAATVSLKLSAAGRKLLAKSKRLKVVLTVAVRDAAGNAATVRKTLTLTVARARGRARSRRR